MSSLAKLLKPLIVTILFVLGNCVCAQSYNSSSKKAIKYFEKARQEFVAENYEEVMANVDKALQIDDDFTDAHLLKAELYLNLNNDSMAIKSFENVFAIDSMSFPKCSISLSKLYSKHLQFDKAINLLDWYLALDNQKESLREIAAQQLNLACFRKSLVDDPVTYEPRNIGGDVNTQDDEYVNQYYVNEDKIIFTKRYKLGENEYSSLEENVFVTMKHDSIWSMSKLLLGSFSDIGAANISADGNEIYFSGCGWESGSGSCDIYCVRFNGGRWSHPINLRSVNTSGWESQPCISYDGKELYFVRRNRNARTSDIYVSKRDDEGNWQDADFLFNVNTDGNEMAPFIHYDGKTLYFSSDTHFGMGGYDLFMSQRDENGEWNEPVNLGYPLNTYGDEINVVVLNDATKAYMSALRNEGFGRYDIYEFDLDEKFRPQYVEIEKPTVEEYYADALEKQESVVLKNIYFDFDSAKLRADSEEGVSAVYKFLVLNPDKNILLEGHTDDIGNEDYNLKLSEKRAESVKNALINKGIAAERIKTKGCGSSQPLSTNNFDDELKTLNRRVSMSLID